MPVQKPTHPSEFIKEDILEEFELTQISQIDAVVV
jgi:plasmid maintenance system antidote protein VapI